MSSINRRRFLTAAGMGVAALGAGFLGYRRYREVTPGDRLVVGFIGVGGQGGYNLAQVSEHAYVAALCDVDEGRAANAREVFPHATFYTDFRRLVEQKGLDAVVIATPDHTHAPAAMAALRSGLHVYCEKPLGHTVQETRLLAEEAARQKRVTQLGMQIHSGDNYRRVVELVQAGAIGTIEEVHVWTKQTWGVGDRPRDTPPVPDGLHFDLWLGPAPERPYSPAYLPREWRRWWDFGGGSLPDMGCHHMDLPFWALSLRVPTKVSAEGPPPHPDGPPSWLIARYEFPARGTQPPVKLTWYDGGKRPPHFAEGKLPTWGDGTLFVGSKGMILADYNKRRLLPEKDFAGFVPPEPTIPQSIGHHREWVEACKTGGPTTCNFDYGGALTEAAILGTVAYRLGRPIGWDPKALKVPGEPEAERFLCKEYRSPWTL